MKTQITTQELKKVITTKEEFELIAKEIYFMNFTRLVKLGFSLKFASEKATVLSEKQMNLIIK